MSVALIILVYNFWISRYVGSLAGSNYNLGNVHFLGIVNSEYLTRITPNLLKLGWFSISEIHAYNVMAPVWLFIGRLGNVGYSFIVLPLIVGLLYGNMFQRDYFALRAKNAYFPLVLVIIMGFFQVAFKESLTEIRRDFGWMGLLVESSHRPMIQHDTVGTYTPWVLSIGLIAAVIALSFIVGSLTDPHKNKFKKVKKSAQS